MKRFALLFICTLAIFMSFTSHSVLAQGGGLVIAPKRVVFDKNQRVIEVLLANRGSSEKRYRISVANRTMQENGQLKQAVTPAEGEFFAKDYVRYSPRQITLGPKETQKIRIMSRLKGDAQDGEYRSHLVVQELPDPKDAEAAAQNSGDDLEINVQAIFGISIPVIMRKGDLSAQASLSAPKIIQDGGDRYLQIAVNREGNKSFMGTANVFTGSKKIGMLKNISVYMSINTRVVSIKLDPDYAGSLSGKTSELPSEHKRKTKTHRKQKSASSRSNCSRNVCAYIICFIALIPSSALSQNAEDLLLTAPNQAVEIEATNAIRAPKVMDVAPNTVVKPIKPAKTDSIEKTGKINPFSVRKKDLTQQFPAETIQQEIQEPVATSPKYQGSFKKKRPDDDLLVFSLKLGRGTLLEALLVYEDLDTGKYYLPLSDLTEALEFPINVDNNNGIATGWFLSEAREFSLDLNKTVMRADKQEFNISPQDIEWHEDGIYVSLQIIEKWFPITLDVEFSELAVIVKSLEPLPIEIRLAREEKRQTIANIKSNKRIKYEIDPVESPLFNIPVIDVDTQFTYENTDSAPKTLRANLSARATGIAFGHDFDASLNEDTSSDQPPDIRATLGRKDTNRNLFGLGISEYSLGDISADSISLISRGGAGRGGALSTYALDSLQSVQSGTVRLRGELPVGYQVDVNRNAQLLGFLEEPDENGEYIFDLDVLPGLNVFELVFYGPQGQRDVREERIFVPVNPVKKYEFNFKADVIQNQTNLFTDRASGTDEDTGQYRVTAQAEYGLTDTSSLYSALTSSTLNGEREHYGLLRYSQSIKSVRSDLTYARSIKNAGQALSLRMQTIFKGLSAQIQHNYFKGFTSEQTENVGVSGDLEHQTSLRLSGAMPLLNNIPFSLDANRVSNAEGLKRYDWQLRATKNIKKIRVTAEIDQQIEDDVDRLTNLNVQVSSRFPNLVVRGNLGYEVEPERVLSSISLNADWHVNRANKSVLRTGFQHSGGGDSLQTYTLGYSRTFNAFRLGVNASYNTNDELQALLSTSFSLGYDPVQNQLLMRQEQLAGRAIFVPHVYYDKNGNAVFDEDDEWLEGVLFSGTGVNKKAATGPKGSVYLTSIEPYARTTLELNELSLEDPYLRSQVQPRDYILRNAQIIHRNFPVILVGEVDGDIYRVKNGRKTEAQSMIIQILKDGSDEVILEQKSEFDGFYWMQGIPMGKYQARIKPEQTNELGYCQPSEQRFMLESEEPFSSLEPFTLWPKTGDIVTFDRKINVQQGEDIWEELKSTLMKEFVTDEMRPTAYLSRLENSADYQIMIRDFDVDQAQAFCDQVSANEKTEFGACRVLAKATCPQNYKILPEITEHNEIEDLSEKQGEQKSQKEMNLTLNNKAADNAPL